jgi:hypothetical protein
MFLYFFLLTLALLVAALFAAYRFYRKAAVYDEIIQYLYDDIVTNLRQFAKMHTSNLMADEPEIANAHRNMIIMGKRLEEIFARMEGATGLRLRPPPMPPRPKVE